MASRVVPTLGLRVLSLLVLLSLIHTCSAAVLNRHPVTKRADEDATITYVASPYYPAPHGGWDDEWTEAYEKATELVARMTLAEKTNLTSGSGIYMGSV